MDFSSCLPLELLQKVFRHYLSDRKIPVQSFDHSDGLWVLGQVNSTWRCATLSDSTLWSSINGRFAHPHDHPSNTTDLPVTRLMPPPRFNKKDDDIYICSVSDGVVEALTCILSRSRLTPLSLSLHFPISVPPKTIPSTWRTFCSLLFTQSNRFQTFFLTAPTAIWEEFSRIPPARLPLLRELHAILENCSMVVPVTSCCPSLIGLEIEAHYTATDNTYFDGSHVQMAQLRDLKLRAPFVLECITAPNLYSLTLMESIYMNSRRSLFLRLGDFLHRSNCALTALDFFGYDTLDKLLTILSSIPTLESLSCLCDLNMTFYERMSLILPKLRILSLHPTTSTRLFRGVFVSHADAIPLIDMVESRLAGGVLESVNVGCVAVKSLSEREKERLAALNALPRVRVDIIHFQAIR
ncbi:hypothetical protein IW262DRAFT_534147 [Armillaria fumosa]|nr:hypothetical protein IW262DRAFT_534147 [Armillaria fumosa]